VEVHLYKQRNSRYWWVRYTDNGQLIRKSTKCTRKAEAKLVAEQIRKKWLQRQGIGIEEKLTLKELIREVENDYKANEKKSLDRVRYSSKHLIRLLGEETSLEDINEGFISKYKLTRKDEGAANGTINRELALLRRGFNLLRFQKRIIKPPVIKFLKESTPRQGFIEPWEFQEILKHLPLYLKPLITFLYKTGWRKSEALNLTWDMVDLGRKCVMLPPELAKNEKPRLFPFDVDEELEELFARLWNERKAFRKENVPYVFLNKNRTDRIKDFRHAWQVACEKAGVGKKLIHDMRRSAVRNLVESGVSEKVAMELTGHLTRTVFENYHIVAIADLREAVKKVSSHTKKLREQGKPGQDRPEGLIPGVLFQIANEKFPFAVFTEHPPKILDDGRIDFFHDLEKAFKDLLRRSIEKGDIESVRLNIELYKDGTPEEKKYVQWASEVLAEYEVEQAEKDTKREDVREQERGVPQV